jgi:hypothetical protein
MGENYIMRRLMICTLQQILFGRSNREEWNGRGMYHIWGEVHAGFWWGNLEEIDHLQDIGIDGRLILRWIFR